MKISEINSKISKLENSIFILKAIRKEFIDDERDEAIIDALDDGIKYTSLRLEEYKTADWIMCDIKQEF